MDIDIFQQRYSSLRLMGVPFERWEEVMRYSYQDKQKKYYGCCNRQWGIFETQPVGKWGNDANPKEERIDDLLVLAEGGFQQEEIDGEGIEYEQC